MTLNDPQKRTWSSPELSALTPLLQQFDPRRAAQLSPRAMSKLRPVIKIFNSTKCKLIRFARGPHLKRFATAIFIALHVGLVALFAKCVLFPTADPREDWWPRYWGVPWGSESWASIAAAKKAQYYASDGQEIAMPVFDDINDRLDIKLPPQRLKYPVLWAAPFFSKSGYGTEAISYVAGMLESGMVAPEDLWITQAGDCKHPDALDGLDPKLRQLLWDQEWHNITKRLSPADRDRPMIVVCHVFPDCWRSKEDDNVSNWAIIRAFAWLFKEFKIRMYGVDDSKENGCPCPNEYIKDRIVYRVGRSMFETEKLPGPLADHAKELDEVLVPSEFSVDSFIKSGIAPEKLHILPQGINTTLFDPSRYAPINLGILGGQQVTGKAKSYNNFGLKHSSRSKKNKDGASKGAAGFFAKIFGKAAIEGEKQLMHTLDDFVTSSFHHSMEDPTHPGKKHSWMAGRGQAFRFLSVFKWETRKGWDILLKGFFEEFKATEPVELHIVTHAFGAQVDDFRHYIRDAIKKLMDVKDEDLDTNMPRVYVYDKYIPDRLYPGLYQAMDALVIPTHGEGWGRPQFEAMAMGLPVISTNWSGLTAFMDDTVSYPIKVQAVVDVDDPSPEAFYWFKGQRWAQPDKEHMKKLMRQVMKHRLAAQRKGDAGKKRIQAEYSIPAVAEKALAEILRMQQQLDIIVGKAFEVASSPGYLREPTISEVIEEDGAGHPATSSGAPVLDDDDDVTRSKASGTGKVIDRGAAAGDDDDDDGIVTDAA